jgi:hypothetical protein
VIVEKGAARTTPFSNSHIMTGISKLLRKQEVSAPVLVPALLIRFRAKWLFLAGTARGDALPIDSLRHQCLPYRLGAAGS